MSHGGHANESGHHGVGHVVPVWVLAAVLVALLVLTWITYAIAGIPLGNWNIVVAIGIASVKAALVALFFMHLRWDKPFNGIVLISSLAFVALFIVFAMIDSNTYQPTLDPGTAPGMVERK